MMEIKISDSNLDYLFNPRTIAIAGVSSNLDRMSTGREYMRGLIECGFKGKVYPVSTNGGEIFGSKIYPSVSDIPDGVDYVISSIPARNAPQLVMDCAARGVRAIHFFTSGFSEIEDERGEHLEAEVIQLARQNGIRILGPNCMGLYCPGTGLTFSVDTNEQRSFPTKSGPLAFVSQSGGNSIYCIKEATTRGVYLSKLVSYGNASDLNETDFLDYLADDPETEIIAAYIEGVKDGSRFLRVLKRAASLKPVIIFKAGITEDGTRVAASHTGAIAGSNRVWESLLRQAGAIQVYSVEEVVDVASLFLRFPLPGGRNAAIIGSGGGASVHAADDCATAGLVLPGFPALLRQKLKEVYSTDVGRIYRNPVDLAPRLGKKLFLDAIRAIADYDQIDLLIMHITFDTWCFINRVDVITPYVDAMLGLKSVTDKPAAIVLHYNVTAEAEKLTSEVYEKLYEAGFPIFPSITRVASAINKFLQYHEWHQGSTAGRRSE